MPKYKVVHTETHSKDSIDYEIRVVQREGGLWGEWTCGKCGQSGASSKQESEQKWAVWSAVTNLGMHHGTQHGRQK